MTTIEDPETSEFEAGKGWVQAKKHKKCIPITAFNWGGGGVMGGFVLADLRGAPGTRAPRGSKLFHFHAVFGKKFAK